jgi:hypothetical protein
VELGGRGQHLHLGQLPQAARGRHQASHQITHARRELPLRRVVAESDDTEDLVDARVGGQCAVEDGELTLEALRNVVATAAGLDHGRHELDVEDGGEVAGLVEAVEAALLHALARDLVGDLVAPLVDHGHVDVVDEYGHAFGRGRTVRRAHALLHVALDNSLCEKGLLLATCKCGATPSPTPTPKTRPFSPHLST